MNYTHSVNFFKNVNGSGWVFSSFRTTEDNLRKHLKVLAKQQANGTVRMIDAVKITKPGGSTNKD